MLEEELRRQVDGEVRFDAGSRALYSTDASNYRQVPIGVVIPRTVEAGAQAVRVCREHDAPLLSRGGGTSLAGQCCNTAVVIDWSKYCDQVLEVDAAARTALVEPGVVLDELNDRTKRSGLVFGPKPATHSHCTIGGMLGNNSCGATAQAYGKTGDNVADLEVLTYEGERFWTSDPPQDLVRRLRILGERHAGEIRRRFPEIPRLVSGYALDALLPDRFDLARALVGSESTLVTILRARLRLVDDPPGRCLLVLGFDDVYGAAAAAPEVSAHDPIAVEGLDDKLIRFEGRKHLNPHALGLLPEGRGWLMVHFGADTDDEAVARARELADKLGRPCKLFDSGHFAEMWAVREAGLGATAEVPLEPDTWEGWEDSAVPPDRLADYLRDLHGMLEEYGYAEAAPLYGHFGQGCVHTRIPFELVTAPGVAKYRRFLEHATDLVVSYGGSMSGEHGDGQVRGEMWPRMFGEELMPAFAELKSILDPRDRMSPGKLIHPRPLDTDLRLGPSYEPLDAEFGMDALRCVGVGKCRSHQGGVMCPSYRVTREEKHSTRGRARLLFEMMNGDVIGGWRSPEVRDALDLCLSCKGCKSDCPVNVDMASYKARFLSEHYKGRVRPAAHYSMGWLPLLARLAAFAPGAVNVAGRIPGARRLAGISPQRPLPAFAATRFSDAFRRRGPSGPGLRGEVLLWPDTFMNAFHPRIGAAAVRVLEAAGFTVRLPPRTACCGLTWISTGQLGIAKRVIKRTVRMLRDPVRRGLPVVSLEPSCTAVFRADAPELFPHDPDVRRLCEQTVTLAELLDQHGVDPPPLDRPVIAQQHCHQHAVIGFEAESRLLRAAGADLRLLDAGCCGMAGDFGFTAGHYDVSMACAEEGLLPAVREAPEDALILADGFSCRTQIEHARVGRRAVHLAEALDGGGRAAGG